MEAEEVAGVKGGLSYVVLSPREADARLARVEREMDREEAAEGEHVSKRRRMQENEEGGGGGGDKESSV